MLHDPNAALEAADAMRFAALSAELHANTDEAEVARTLVVRGVELVPGAETATVTAPRRRGGLRTLAASAPAGEAWDASQVELGEGPTLDALLAAREIVTGDVPVDPRWETWRVRAATLGARSVLALPVQSGRATWALTLYATTMRAFDGQATLQRAKVLAVHAATALGAARAVSGLRSALESRHLIGVAQGVVMQRYAVDLEVSFDVLRRHSSMANVKLHEVAAEVVRTGELPSLQDPRPDVD